MDLACFFRCQQNVNCSFVCPSPSRVYLSILEGERDPGGPCECGKDIGMLVVPVPEVHTDITAAHIPPPLAELRTFPLAELRTLPFLLLGISAINPFLASRPPYFIQGPVDCLMCKHRA